MTELTSFGRPVRALVAGANGAIGSALVEHLAASPHVESVVACARTPRASRDAKVRAVAVEVLDEESILAALEGITRIDLALVATGMLHTPGGLQPEKSWRALNKAALIESFAVNSVGPALLAKHILPLLPRQGKAVFAALSARVGSISDNHLGGWYGYRASKAALNQLIRTLSIELARTRPQAICVALHPGTVDSALSRPFQGGVAESKRFAPMIAAQHLLTVIDTLDPTRNGQLLDWDGSTIAP
jgi:NAD(P)-dependent dehydrogenase (short-subunit alcohol dehydrogenase family)